MNIAQVLDKTSFWIQYSEFVEGFIRFGFLHFSEKSPPRCISTIKQSASYLASVPSGQSWHSWLRHYRPLFFWERGSHFPRPVGTCLCRHLGEQPRFIFRNKGYAADMFLDSCLHERSFGACDGTWGEIHSIVRWNCSRSQACAFGARLREKQGWGGCQGYSVISFLIGV